MRALEITDYWLRRQLSSDERAGTSGRDFARRAQRDFMRRSWRGLLPASLALMMIPIAVAYFVFPDGVLRGVVIGGGLVGPPLFIWSWIIQASGAAPAMMGDQAEQFTAQELRKLIPRGWRLVNHFSLTEGDIDHVLVGPGGIYAIETKWIGSNWHSEYGRKRLEGALKQIQRNARQLRLWQSIKRHNVRVEPILVLWSGQANDPVRENHITSHEGVCVVPGRALATWRRALSDDSEGALPPDLVNEVWRAIAEQALSRDASDRQRDVPIRSLTEMLSATYQAIVAAALAVAMVAQVLTWSNAPLLTGGGAMALSSLAMLASRLGVWTAVASGAAIGSGLVGVALTGASIFEAVL